MLLLFQGICVITHMLPLLHSVRPTVHVRTPRLVAASSYLDHTLFVECGFGADQHGQNATKACVRAARNAIEFNSLPNIGRLIPGGYDEMRLHVQIGVPVQYLPQVDVTAITSVFPYGKVRVELEPGGLLADSGVALVAMGDMNSDMVIAVACVTVGYADSDVDDERGETVATRPPATEYSSYEEVLNELSVWG